MTDKTRMMITGILIILLLAAAANADSVQRTVLRVENMTCGYCLSRINNKLSDFEGMMGMRANLRQGIVTVDHRFSLEGGEIVGAITSLGYPASIMAQSEVDEKQAFSALTAGQYGSRCGRWGGAVSQEGTNEEGDLSPEQRRSYGGGCGLQRSGRSGGCCGASASAWKEIYRRYSGDREGAE